MACNGEIAIIIYSPVSARSRFYDIIPGTYNLEISSPGLTRTIKKVRDFERFKGKLVKIKTMTDIQGRRVFIGSLIDFVGDVASVEMDGRVYFIPYDEIERANLELDF